MDTIPMDRSIAEWNEATVGAWLASLGFPQYEQNMKDHKIDGEVLCRLDSEHLKEIGITSIGQRVAILKAVFHVKLAHNEPIEPGDYVPPSEAAEKSELTVERLHTLVKEQSDRLRAVEQDNKRLQERLHVVFEELSGQSRRSDEDRVLRKQPSMKWAPTVKAGYSPTKPVPDGVANESPHPSPSRAEHDLSANNRSNREAAYGDRSGGTARTSSTQNVSSPNGSTPHSRASPANSRGELSGQDTLRSFKVSLEDPTWKVLPAALKKYKIKDEDWRNYAMFICYGSTDRCLSYDEKPLLLFQRLKDAKKNPVFMLKHIKDIRSPIAQAQQKQQARLQARMENSANRDSSVSASRPGQSSHPPVRGTVRQPISGPISGISTISTNVNGSMHWPETMSPVTENKPDDGSPSMPRSKMGHEIQATADVKVSYAVSIYPYMAEHDDEFDVAVGDTFVILSRGKGWWVTQRDFAGNGQVEISLAKQSWVPAGCLLETNRPIATSNEQNVHPSKLPILPSYIVSTSYPGVALMEWRKKGEDELDLFVDDLLRVFKRYNHWSYVVKEDSGERGWVPSWFIGKIGSSSATPPTPSLGHQPLAGGLPITLATGDGANGNNQVSPLSNAFSFAGRSAPGS